MALVARTVQLLKQSKVPAYGSIQLTIVYENCISMGMAWRGIASIAGCATSSDRAFFLYSWRAATNGIF